MVLNRNLNLNLTLTLNLESTQTIRIRIRIKSKKKAAPTHPLLCNSMAVDFIWRVAPFRGGAATKAGRVRLRRTHSNLVIASNAGAVGAEWIWVRRRARAVSSCLQG